LPRIAAFNFDRLSSGTRSHPADGCAAARARRVALAAFWVGLKTKDRVRQETFTRLLRCLLAGMALFFIYRGLFVGAFSH
jgi:hypothetical protein